MNQQYLFYNYFNQQKMSRLKNIAQILHVENDSVFYMTITSMEIDTRHKTIHERHLLLKQTFY